MYNLKHRPNNFNEMFGNKYIVKEMKMHSIKFTYPQVIIFEGLTGGGKSTAHKIVSKTINCHKPIKLENGEHIPCEDCPSCKAINTETYCWNTVFFDSTNTSGKNDVNELRSIVSKAPMYDKNNIIIIEECHNLSKSAMEALLTLTEKPRKNTYFILCTTNENKLPTTLKRRGQKYVFKGLTSEELYDFGASVLKKENVLDKLPKSFFIKESENKQSVLDILIDYSQKSAGIFISHLQRCINSEIYTQEAIEEAFGFISEDKIYDIILNILNRKPIGLNQLDSLEEFEAFYKKFRSIIVNVLVYSMTDEITYYFKSFADKIIATKVDLMEVLEHLNNVQSNPYLNKTSLAFNIIKFYKSAKVVPLRVLKN